MNQIKLHGESPQIEIKADGELPLISFDEQGYQSYRTIRMIEEAERKKQNFRFWLPLIVSNSISIAALLVAILAYIKK